MCTHQTVEYSRYIRSRKHGHCNKGTNSIKSWYKASFILLTLEGGEGLHLIMPHRNRKNDLLKFSSYIKETGKKIYWSLVHISTTRKKKCTVRAENYLHYYAPDTPIGTISKPWEHTVQIIPAPRRSNVLLEKFTNIRDIIYKISYYAYKACA